MSNMWKALQMASVYICIILGAGFASGQEIMQFFTVYGLWGAAGLLVSGFLFCMTGWAVLDMVYVFEIRDYNDFMKTLLGKNLGKCMEYLSIIFLLTLFCTMLAGAGAVAKEAFGATETIGIVTLAVFCFVTFLFDLDGLVAMNTVLAPFMVFGAVCICLYSVTHETQSVFLSFDAITSIPLYWLFSAILYVSYNIITAISVLTEMGDLVTNRKIAKWAGIVSGFITALLGFCIFIPLYMNFNYTEGYEIPMLRLTMGYGDFIKGLYLVILLLAIYTTAIASGFSAIQWIKSKIHLHGIPVKLALTVFGVLTAHMGFSNFVGTVYPIFGYLGLFEMIFIILVFGLRKKGISIASIHKKRRRPGFTRKVFRLKRKP